MPSLMESVVTLDVGAQEPWPNDVKLYQPYALEQILLPDNANCLSVQAFLHMCGLPFQIEHRANAEFMSPSGKVPFIKCGAFVVSELEPIVQFVGNKGISLSEDLSADQKSDLRAYMSIIYTVLMNAELYICWCDKRTYNEVTKVRNGSVYPWPLNHFQTWSKRSAVLKKLKVLGWYQKSLEAVYQEVENCCQALSERLDGKEYFFGTKPSELDAYVYGHVFSILSSPEYSRKLTSIILKFPNLTAHCKRICLTYMNNTSLNFSELSEPIEKASELIINSATVTHEISKPDKVTTIKRYIKYMKEIESTPAVTEVCVSEDDLKRTKSETDFSITEFESKNSNLTYSLTTGCLSEEDHEYLCTLFCSDKPPKSMTTENKLKAKNFQEKSENVTDSSITDDYSSLRDIKSDDLTLDSSNSVPTELDALVFGHLFTIFTTPLPNSDLASIVRNYPPLVNLVKNIEEKYFKRVD